MFELPALTQWKKIESFKALVTECGSCLPDVWCLILWTHVVVEVHIFRGVARVHPWGEGSMCFFLEIVHF